MVSNRTERCVQFAIGLLVALSAAMLDVAQNQWLLTFIVVPCVVFTHIFTDRLQYVQLPRIVVALSSLGAIVFFYSQFEVNSSIRQLNTIGNLLMAWSSLTLFQKKAERVYGSLVVFSLLAVVVAAVLNVGIAYGILLLAYTIVAFFAMQCLYLYREEVLVLARAEVGDEALLAASDLAVKGLLNERSIIAYQPRTSDRAGEAVLGWPTIRQTFTLMMVTFVFAVIYFYSIPRSSRDQWKQNHGIGIGQTVGFSNRITFSEMGRILESDRLAMRVAFIDEESGQTYEVFGDVYIFGKPLLYYGNFDGETSWTGYGWRRKDSVRLRPHRPGRPEDEVIRLEVALEAARDNTRFGVFPFTRSSNTSIRDSLRWSYSRQQLINFRYIENPGEYLPNRYSVATTAFRNGVQSVIVPAYEEWPSTRTSGQLHPLHIASLLKINRNRFPGLIRIADELTANVDDRDNKFRVTRELQNFFKAGDFSYTLDFTNVQRDKRLDPVEDFVVNHRTGHCEYFASGLAIMLRSQGIPARVVVGYRGGDYNPVGKYYQFYERDAHAWVECYLATSEVPDNAFTKNFFGRTGGWLRIDPTPTSGAETNVRRTQLDQWVDYAQFIWNDYVVDLNHEKQREALYDPFAVSNTARFGREILTLDSDSLWSRASAATSTVLKSTRKLGVAAQIGLLVLLITGCVLLLRVTVLFIRRRSWRTRGHNGKGISWQQRPVDFYARLEHLIRRLGVTRHESQTPLEFANAARVRLLELNDQTVVALIPGQIVARFYEVRFGERQLELKILQQIEGDLALLEEVVSGMKA
jgi:transglutaminase-like putative cysteine protease